MKRIHIVGLPRSGTTALSQKVAVGLGLPLVVEPIFLWNDGFRIDLMNGELPNAYELQRLRSRIAKLDEVFQVSGGFVEKTPSSVLLAPIFSEIQKNSIFIVVTRDRSAIVNSLRRMIFDSQDGNLQPSESFFLRKLKVRCAKFFLMGRMLGPSAAVSVILRYFMTGRRGSIVSFSNEQDIEKFVDTAMTRLAELNVGSANSVLSLSYDQFLHNPERAVGDVLEFCNRSCQSIEE